MTAQNSPLSDPNIIDVLRTATEAAARAACDWIGRGDRVSSNRAAINAMREALEALPVSGTVVIGESEKREAPGLFTGDRIGDPSSNIEVDIAVDPVEGTSYLARGMTNAMAVIAMAPTGTMFDPGPTFYMEKFAAPPMAKGKVPPDASVEEKLDILAEVLGKPISQLTVFVLEKPRHRDLVERIHRAGARVALYPAGDVAGALMAAIPESGIDALMGTGGTPEGIISACAIRSLGGELLARLDPQLPSEQIAVRKAGLDTARWYSAAELVRSDTVYFAATGITTGLLFDGVQRSAHHESTQSLLVYGPQGVRQLVTTFHRRTGGTAQ